MGVYIKGMEMPKGHPVCIVIDAAGQARCYDLNNDRYADDKLFEVVPVPPHGRLIDADALDADLERQDMHTGEWDAVGFSIEEIENAPTIIPAEEGVKRCHCQKPMLKKKRFHGDSPSL